MRGDGPPRGRPRVVGVLAVLAILLVSACSTPAGRRKPGPTAAGGTLEVLLDQPVAHWDPQRMSGGPEAEFAVRTYLRTLTTYTAAGVGVSPGLVGDLATTTGTPGDGGRTWTFTLISDAKWQDGRPVTCDDVKYGVSRNFARDLRPGGLPYAVSLLDIPMGADATGTQVSAYSGPYVGTGQGLYDKAVSCAGRVLTFRLRAPAQDFGEAVSLPAFAPVSRAQDHGAAGNLAVFSCGPYMLEGAWSPETGGRFVRNRGWTALSDEVREANPDAIDLVEGISTTTAIQRIIDDRGPDRYAVTWASAPSAMQQRLTASPALAERVTNPAVPTVEYLAPDPRSPAMAGFATRQAFAMATDRNAFVSAYGGPAAMTPSFSILPSTVPGRRHLSPFGVGAGGDWAGARAVLTSARVTLPVPIRVGYQHSQVADAAFGALRVGWERAGFAVTLVPTTTDLAAGSGPAATPEVDVAAASARADWPTGGAVIPERFGSRVGRGAPGPGPGDGSFADAQVEAAIDAAEATADVTQRDSDWAAVDEQLARLGAYVALAQPRYLFVHGSGVLGYQDSPATGGHVDLATVRLVR